MQVCYESRLRSVRCPVSLSPPERLLLCPSLRPLARLKQAVGKGEIHRSTTRSPSRSEVCPLVRALGALVLPIPTEAESLPYRPSFPNPWSGPSATVSFHFGRGDSDEGSSGCSLPGRVIGRHCQRTDASLVRSSRRWPGFRLFPGKGTVCRPVDAYVGRQAEDLFV